MQTRLFTEETEESRSGGSHFTLVRCATACYCILLQCTCGSSGSVTVYRDATVTSSSTRSTHASLPILRTAHVRKATPCIVWVDYVIVDAAGAELWAVLTVYSLCVGTPSIVTDCKGSLDALRRASPRGPPASARHWRVHGGLCAHGWMISSRRQQSAWFRCHRMSLSWESATPSARMAAQ